jgi:hypothetical protein
VGMFDYINYECVCPVCRSKVTGFQSKGGDCQLDTLEPQQVSRFYSSCGNCGCWINFDRIPLPVENFTRTVEGKLKDGNRPILDKHTKDIRI